MQNAQHVRSKNESYFIVTMGFLGSLTWLYGAINKDIQMMNRGINIMATSMTFFMTEKKLYRYVSLIGAVGGLFTSTTSVPNLICGFSGALAGCNYLNNLLNDHEPTQLTS